MNCELPSVLPSPPIQACTIGSSAGRPFAMPAPSLSHRRHRRHRRRRRRRYSLHFLLRLHPQSVSHHALIFFEGRKSRKTSTSLKFTYQSLGIHVPTFPLVLSQMCHSENASTFLKRGEKWRRHEGNFGEPTLKAGYTTLHFASEIAYLII